MQGRWSEVARAVLGAGAERTAAIGFTEATLIVTVPDGAWAGEIRLHESELISALGGGRSPIKRIRSIVRSEGERPAAT